MSSKKYKEIDHLMEDPIIMSQRYVCISFISPEGLKNCTVRGVKIRGVYATAEEAKARAKEISEFDSDFDVFVGEMGKWLPWDPDPNSVKDTVFQEKELNELAYQRKQSLKKIKKVQDQRKKDMMQRAAREEQKQIVKQRRKNKKKANKLSKSKSSKSKSLKSKPLNKEDDIIKRKMDEINKEKEMIDESKRLMSKEEEEISDIDKQIKTIEQLYNQMNQTGQTGQTEMEL